MTGYTKSISEIPRSTSEDNKSVKKKTAATDFGQIQNNVSECKVRKIINIHNIIKRFSDSGGFSVYKRQGRRPPLNACLSSGLLKLD